MNPSSFEFRAIYALPVLALFAVTMSGCSEPASHTLDGAPDGNAELLTVEGGKERTVEHTNGGFLEVIEQSDRVVLIDFWGPHCGPCVHMAPELEQIAQEYQDEVSVVKVNVESSRNAELVSYFGIRAVPHLQIYVNGRQMGMTLGYANAGRIAAAMQPALKVLAGSSGE